MQAQKISFKNFTSRELIKYKRLYYSREFASTVNPMNSYNKENNTYFIYGTIGTLSAVKRMHFRKQLIAMNGINVSRRSYSMLYIAKRLIPIFSVNMKMAKPLPELIASVWLFNLPPKNLQKKQNVISSLREIESLISLSWSFAWNFLR